MKRLTMLAVALGAVAATSSAFAVPTLTISDGLGGTSVTILDGGALDQDAILHPGNNGVVVYANSAFDNLWRVVISTGETKPALGSATSPMFDLNVQATSLGGSVPANNLVISFSDNGFGPTAGHFQAILSGHLVGGTGQPVTYNTYYDAGNVTGAQTTLLTSMGPSMNYNGVNSGGSFNQALYSITQVVTIGINPVGTPGGMYSLDASLICPVPDGGTTVLLLGAALSGLAFLRRKIA